MKRHENMLKEVIEYGHENLSYDERINASFRFLRAIKSQLLFSKNGTLSAKKITEAYKSSIDYQIEDRNTDVN